MTPNEPTNKEWIITDISSTQDQPETREALRLESEGAVMALAGRVLEIAAPATSLLPPVLDLGTLKAETFLAAVLRGEVESRGGKRREQEKEVNVFVREALTVMNTTTPPAFLKSVGSAWSRLSQGRADAAITQRMARDCAGLLSSAWRMGHAGGLANSIMDASLHKLDIPAFLRVKGWLAGEVKRLSEAVSTKDTRDNGPLALLEKNQGTILTRALKTGDPLFAVRAARAIPEMIAHLETVVARMRESNDPYVREAANLLGGDTETKWRGNFGSLVNHAIASGRLMDYVREVETRFGTGDVLREIEAGISDLGEHTAEAMLLRSNKASIISRALHHGKLDYRDQLKTKLQGLGSSKLRRMSRLEEENRRLKDLVANLTLDKHQLEDKVKK